MSYILSLGTVKTLPWCRTHISMVIDRIYRVMDIYVLTVGTKSIVFGYYRISVYNRHEILDILKLI